MKAESYRDLPEWQAAWADYVSPPGEDADPEQAFALRVDAAVRMRNIEK